MTKPDSNPPKADVARASVRFVALLALLLSLALGFHAFVALAFGIAYREPLPTIVLYGTWLFAVVLALIILAKTIWDGAFPKQAFSIKTLLFISLSYSVWICLLVANN